MYRLFVVLVVCLPHRFCLSLLSFKSNLHRQFGNTCYFNSVLQALYYCVQFREAVLAHVPKSPADNNLLVSLKDLFATVSSSTRRSGAFAPKKFFSRLKTDNGTQA